MNNAFSNFYSYQVPISSWPTQPPLYKPSANTASERWVELPESNTVGSLREPTVLEGSSAATAESALAQSTQAEGVIQTKRGGGKGLTTDQKTTLLRICIDKGDMYRVIAD